jgi:hypothetical protein
MKLHPSRRTLALSALHDAFIVTGAGLITYGVYLAFDKPWAFIVGGALMVAMTIRAAR